MSRRRIPLGRRFGAVAVALIAIASFAGCAASGAGAGDPPATAVESPDTGTAGVTDEETCQQFSDVMTIVQNAWVGVTEGRMERQEQEGWHRLATRVLDRIPSTGEGAVSDALAAAKSAAPAVALGAYGPPTIDSDEWSDAANALSVACNEAGFEFGVEMFTGG
jgi:hypothetical protein